MAVQLSASSVISSGSAAGTSAEHCTVTFAGAVPVGAMSSFTMMVWVTSMKLPQSSVTLYVLVMVSGQVFPSDTSPWWVTVGLAVQLSASSVTTVTSTAGTSPIHSTFTATGLEAVGLVMSLTVMVWVTNI